MEDYCFAKHIFCFVIILILKRIAKWRLTECKNLLERELYNDTAHSMCVIYTVIYVMVYIAFLVTCFTLGVSVSKYYGTVLDEK